jgi:hypothetical protein
MDEPAGDKRGECVVVLDVANEVSEPSTSTRTSEFIYMLCIVSVLLILFGFHGVG